MYFILKSTLCLFLFWGFYKLFLEREKMFVFNRFYLLASLVMSFVIPMITIEIQATRPIEETIASETDEVVLSMAIIQETLYDKILELLPFIYVFIVFLLLLRLCVNIYKVVAKTNYLPTKIWQKSKLVFINEPQLPHAFLNYIFINKQDFDNGKIESELLTHELQHVRQLHSYDIILIEIIKSILWFNPLIRLFEKAIKLNHEFLADEGVIQQTESIKSYQYLLLAKARYSVTNSYLASSINYLITKKRLEMMTKKTSYLMALIKKGLAVGLMIVLCFSLSNRVIAQTESGASAEMIKEYKVLMKKYAPEKGRTMSIYKEDVDRMNQIYNQMNVEQRKQYPKIELPEPPPPPITPAVPEVPKTSTIETPKAPKAPKTKSKNKNKEKKIRKKEGRIIPPLPPIPPVPPVPAIPPLPSKKAKTTTSELPKVKSSEGAIPPPPPPITCSEEDIYFINGKKASYKKAMEVMENDDRTISYEEKDGKKIFKITTE